MLSALIFLAGGATGGLLLGMLGVGTALVAVPLLTLVLPWLGVPASDAPLTALATSMAVVAATSISSVLSHHRLGNVAWGVFRTTRAGGGAEARLRGGAGAACTQDCVGLTEGHP